MDKISTKRRLEEAVRNTNLKFPTFQGVVIFGSFLRKENPQDLDIIPVMERYNGEWNLQPIDSEGEPCTDEPDYEMWLKLETYFLSHFPLLPEGTPIKGKYLIGKERGIHYEHLIVLDRPEGSRETLNEYDARPENFVGSETTRSRLLEICSIESKTTSVY